MTLLFATRPVGPGRGLLTAIIFLGALGGVLGFANPVFHLPVLCLLYPATLAWLGQIAVSGRKAFFLGYLQGVIFFTLSLYWLVVPPHWYGGVPLILALPVPLLLALYLALYPAALCLLMYLFRTMPWPLLGLLGGCGFALLEMLRAVALSGFPWLALPSALAIWPSWLQLLPLIGSEALGALLVLCGLWLGLGLARTNFKPVLAAAVIFVLIPVHGYLVLKKEPAPGPMVRVGLVQGNVEQSQKWDQDYIDATVAKYAALTRTMAGEAPPALVIWPETALPFSLQEDSARAQEVRSLARTLHLPLLTGAPGFEISGMSPQSRVDYNRAFLLDASGQTVGVYDKEHLVPFGEYVPLGLKMPFLSVFLSGSGAFTPGVNTAPLKTGHLALGLLICYEAIFPDLAQERVSAGANLLVNISNDAWFGRTAAPEQHLHLALLRAVEQGRYLVRATNTGISAMISPDGRIHEPTPLFEGAVRVYPVELKSGLTPYNRYRALILPGLAVLASLLVLSRVFVKKRPI